jgi:hypothetical protein
VIKEKVKISNLTLLGCGYKESLNCSIKPETSYLGLRTISKRLTKRASTKLREE